ncbi:MAG: DUF99 family protein [Candidatus Micrarchaeota archaeon]|nr:DUF99 family protein [Candidatus Micrarchaeota archaeon]
MLKSGVRIIAFEDSPILKGRKDVLVVGVIGRQDIIEGVLSFRAIVDGNDATSKLARAVKRSRFAGQIRLLTLNGITVAGLNIIDMAKLNRSLGIPVLAITRQKPNPSKLMEAVRHHSGKDSAKKIAVIKRTKEAMLLLKRSGHYFQCVGIEKKDLANFADLSVSLLRLGHIIASGVTSGESHGRM